MFEPEYLRLLMDMGEQDAAARSDEIREFLLAAKTHGSSMSDVTKIYNYVSVNEHIASSGQPTAEQFTDIKRLGTMLS